MGVDLAGCPCGMRGPCCSRPDVSGDHDAFCDCDDGLCDYLWFLECHNCGSVCGHEV